jgi:deoxyribose-phosphate aldolase
MENIASYIDHTILKADTTMEEIERVCHEALIYNFASVCVNPYYVPKVAELLAGSNVKVTSVIGFPLGCSLSEVKAFEARLAVNSGADELDMVINIAALKNKDYDLVYNDIKAVVDAAEDKIVKVIIETCLLTEEEKIKACQLSVQAGADFVKTSTGFSTGGATVADVKLMNETVADKAKVKASGGIRNYKNAVDMIEAGAQRIGASSSVEIVTGKETKKDTY